MKRASLLLVLEFLAACSPAATLTATPAPAAPSVLRATGAPTATPHPAPTPTPLPLVQPWGERQALSLDSSWQMARAPLLDDPLPQHGWQPSRVPGVLYGYNYERAWFQHTFDAPAAWQGRQPMVHFGGAKYNSRVMVNARQGGGCLNGRDAFEVEITDAVRRSGRNTLQVGVRDWTGVCSAGGVRGRHRTRPG